MSFTYGPTAKKASGRLDPWLQSTYDTLMQNTPAYNSGISQLIGMATPEGQQKFADSQKLHDTDWGNQVGQGMAKNLALSGWGQGAQTAAKMFGTEQGYQHGNAVQAQIGSPQWMQGILQMLPQAMNAVGAGSPQAALMQHLMEQYGYSKNLRAADQAAQGPGILGSLAQVAGMVAPFMGGGGGGAGMGWLAKLLGGGGGGGGGGGLGGLLGGSGGMLGPEMGGDPSTWDWQSIFRGG